MPWNWRLLCFAGFQSQKSSTGCVTSQQQGGTVPLLSSTPLLELNGTERKGGKEYGEDPCPASEIMCAFCSQPRHCFCLVCQKNICILLFQSAHQQTTAQPLLCPCSRGFPLSDTVEMNPAVLWCSPLPWESRHCSAPEFFCTRTPLPSKSK